MDIKQLRVVYNKKYKGRQNEKRDDLTYRVGACVVDGSGTGKHERDKDL
jgi:hypothetical protein